MEPTQVVAWDEAPEGANFVLDAEMRGQYFVKVKEDGLYVAQRGPLAIILR